MRILAILFLIFAIGCNSQFAFHDQQDIANPNTQLETNEFEIDYEFFESEPARSNDPKSSTPPNTANSNPNGEIPQDVVPNPKDTQSSNPSLQTPALKCPKVTDTKVKPAIGTGSVYYLPFYREQNTCLKDKMETMKDKKGQVLARMCKMQIENCAMQGSCYYYSKGKLTLFAYHKPLKGEKFNYFPFIVNTLASKCPSGMGPRNTCLDPYRSVAADPAFHKQGDVVYVPDLCGVELPNGETHDGFLIVRDTGDRIKGQGRFDFYIGFDLFQNHVFTKMNLADVRTSRFEYFKVPTKTSEAVRLARHFPLVPPVVRKQAENQIHEAMKGQPDYELARTTQMFFRAKWNFNPQ